MRQRHMNAYWIKEGVFRKLGAVVNARIASHPEEAEKLKQYMANYIRSYYTGHPRS